MKNYYGKFKLSALSTALIFGLTACDSDDDRAPVANDFSVSPSLWLPSTGTIDASDPDGDSLSFSFFDEDGNEITAEDGVYTFDHGTLTVSGTEYSYISITGESAVIDYTVKARKKSDEAQIIISESVSDPLVAQQWGLYNTGQKAYSLSDEMKQGLIDLYVDGGYTDANGDVYTEETATAYWDAAFEASEAYELVAGEDMNVLGAYAQNATGDGVIAVVVDSGLEIAHEDLVDNVLTGRSVNLDYDAADATDPTSSSVSGDHGTSVAGLIAAKGWNSIGSHGVAPDTSLIGMNYLSGNTQIDNVDLIVHGFPDVGGNITSEDNISTFNRSYGITYPTFFTYSEIDETIESYPNLYLRDGLGALNMKSSGNSFEYGSYSLDGSVCADSGAEALGLTCYNGAFESSQAHPYYLSIAAVDANGLHTSYSTAGANVFVSAPSGEYGRWAPAMVTTDQSSCDAGYSGYYGSTIVAWADYYGEEFAASQYPFNYPGHEDNADCNYTSTFNGTSSAAPNASGVVSLILAANSALDWRDVRHILASTSTMNDSTNASVSITIGEGEFVAHDGWVENAAGYNFNNLYGFGRVDAGAAVEMALDYTTDLGDQVVSDWIGGGTVIDEDSLALSIPDNDATGVSYDIEITEELAIEAIQFKFDISNPEMYFGFDDGTQTSAGIDLAIEVTSPSGTRSVLLSSKQALLVPAYDFYSGWQSGYILKGGVIMSNAFYGESSIGTWTVRLLDTSGDSYALSYGDYNLLGVTGITNNPSNSVLEGVSARIYGHAE